MHRSLPLGAVALAVLFDAALEPFAAAVKRYWLWHPTRLPLTWAGGYFLFFGLLAIIKRLLGG